jgi:hypothetical protein
MNMLSYMIFATGLLLMVLRSLDYYILFLREREREQNGINNR